jgi:excisionase family DNA binding protein
MLNKLLRGEEVAQLLSISKAFAYQLMAAGKIPVVRLGRSVRVRPEDLEKYIETSVAGGDEVVLQV